MDERVGGVCVDRDPSLTRVTAERFRDDKALYKSIRLLSPVYTMQPIVKPVVLPV